MAVLRVGGLYRQVAAAIKQSEEMARRLAGVEEAAQVVARTEATRERQGKVIDLASRLRQAETEERKARQAAAVWEQRVSELEGAYKDELISVGKCPLCGGAIDPERLKEAI
jgi:RNA polymerase-binding transcription factor DksA